MTGGLPTQRTQPPLANGSFRTFLAGMRPIGMLVTGALINLTDGSVALVAMAVVLMGLTIAALPSRALRAAQLHPR